MLDNDVLYHLYTPRTRRLHRAYAVVKQLCIPTGYREQIAQEVHDKISHLGFDRTYSTFRMRFFWPGAYTYLKNYVLTCLACQQNKRQVHANKNPILQLPVPLPMTIPYGFSRSFC